MASVGGVSGREQGLNQSQSRARNTAIRNIQAGNNRKDVIAREEKAFNKATGLNLRDYVEYGKPERGRRKK